MVVHLHSWTVHSLQTDLNFFEACASKQAARSLCLHRQEVFRRNKALATERIQPKDRPHRLRRARGGVHGEGRKQGRICVLCTCPSVTSYP